MLEIIVQVDDGGNLHVKAPNTLDPFRMLYLMEQAKRAVERAIEQPQSPIIQAQAIIGDKLKV